MPKALEATPEWLRANTSTRAIGVDKENRRINGGIVALAGNFKTPGRGSFDKAALKEIVALSKKTPAGLKARLSHATLSDDGVSKFLGRWKDLFLSTAVVQRDGQSIEVDAVRGDLHLSDTVFDGKNPHGDIGQWLLDLASEDADALSSSLVLQADQQEQRDKKGHLLTDANGDPLPPRWIPKSLHGADIVTMGDAVDSLLSAQVDVDALPDAVVRRGAELLDRQFAGCDRETIAARCTAWLGRYLDRRFGHLSHSDLAILDQQAAAQIVECPVTGEPCTQECESADACVMEEEMAAKDEAAMLDIEVRLREAE